MLPILQTTNDDLLRYYQRGQLQWARHLGEEAQLDFGIAINNPDLTGVYDANRILDAAIPPGMTPDEIITQADQFFASRHCRCWQWTINPAVEESRRRPLEEELLARNYHPHRSDVMRLGTLPGTALTSRSDLQIIPARASFRHARQIAEQSAACRGVPQLADASMLHLDDSQWDALLALKDGVVVGRIGVLAVGEIGMIENVFIAKPFRRQGIAATMMLRAIEICQRSLFRHVLLGVGSENTAAISLYQKFGFTKVAEAPSFISS